MTATRTLTRKKIKTVNAVDLFCGAGGTSSGMLNAVEELGLKPKLIAINHWDIAIDTHYKNHPDVEHYCQSIESLNPEDIVPSGRLQLLVASPSCTHHSNARGGKPRSDQKRADPWLIMRWVDQLYIENILIENVPEMMTWGPLTAKGKPDKRYQGQYFQRWLDALKVNYNVEYRVLNCADYGDPTTRRRFFLIARRPKHRPIVWPERTHASRKEIAKMALQPDLFRDDTKKLKPWVAAREIIDWELEGKSIFGRKKPLSPNTMRRIFKGLEKHGLKNFLVNLKNNDRRDRSVDEPTFTQAAGFNHQGICEPFIVSTGHTSANGSNTRPIDEPVATVIGSDRIGVVEPFIVPQNSTPATRDINEPAPTITTTSRGIGVVEVEPFTLSVERAQTNRSGPRPVEEPVATITGSPRLGVVEGEVTPFIINSGGQKDEPRSVDEPLKTVLTTEHKAIVEAFLVKFHGGANAENRNYPVDEPIGTLDTSNRFGLVEVEPFIVSAAHGGNTNPARNIDEPLGSVLGTPKFGVVETEPFLIKNFGDASEAGYRSKSIDEPLGTVLASRTHHGLAEPYIIKFYGNGEGADSINEPLSTVTAKDRFALCIPMLGIALDIRFRMLQPHELARAMSFPKDYEFTGNREAKVKQIGNAVPLETAKALCRSLLG